jgi:hypothetical protein
MTFVRDSRLLPAIPRRFLAMSAAVPAGSALILLMFATGCFGFGFGGGPLKGFGPLTIGPFVIGTLAAHDRWLVSPIGLACAAILLFAFIRPTRQKSVNSSKSLRISSTAATRWLAQAALLPWHLLFLALASGQATQSHARPSRLLQLPARSFSRGQRPL